MSDREDIQMHGRRLDRVTLRKATGEGDVERELPLHEASLISKYVKGLFESSMESLPPEEYQTIVEAKNRAEEPPFLSIITRTQGLRSKEFSETLLNLAQQKVTDFELVVVAHNVDEEGLGRLIGLIATQPQWLVDRVSLISIKGGTRVRPLNVGFSFSRGSYLSILDDDDLVFDNWVSVFHEYAKANDGAILYSHTYSQVWGKQVSSSGQTELFAKAPLDTRYCEDFDFLRQANFNNCPSMGLAFPAEVFRDYGLRFDETLTTYEDWDFLMRSCQICGVVNTGIPTSIYRLWEGAENSYSAHCQDEWEKNRRASQKKLLEHPILLPAESYGRLIAFEKGYYHYMKADCGSMKLYLDSRDSSSFVPCLQPSSCIYDYESASNEVVFDVTDERALASFSFSPSRKGLITLENIEITLSSKGKDQVKLSALDVSSNGLGINKTDIAFLVSDPSLKVRLKKPGVVDQVRISFRLRAGVEESLLSGTRLMVRAKAVVNKMVYRLTH
jgi:glycosyltransferase involved in cell wall biosynthesis